MKAELIKAVSGMSTAARNTSKALMAFGKVKPSKTEVIINESRKITYNIKGFIFDKYWRRWMIAVFKEWLRKRIILLFEKCAEKLNTARE